MEVDLLTLDITCEAAVTHSTLIVGTINSSEDQVDQELSTPLGAVKITVIVIVLPVIVLLIVIAVTLLVVAGVVWYVATRRKNTFSIGIALNPLWSIMYIYIHT